MQSVIEEVQSTAIGLVGQAVGFIPGILAAVIILALTRYGAEGIRHLLQKTSERLISNRSLQKLLVQISYITTWIVGVLVAAVIAFPDLGLGDIIALLGLGSVAIGFAFQDIFKNFLAGVILLLQQPFKIGDQIIVAEYEGTVEEIALRSTQIKTYRGEEVVIPNSIVFTSTVQVMTAKPHRRTDLEIGLDYNTPLAEAKQLLLGVVDDIVGIESSPEPEVDIIGFGDSSINFVVRYWTVPQQAQVRRIKTQVMIALKKACDEADYSIPYPIRTVYFFNQDDYSDHYRLNKVTNETASHNS
ncbi:MAG: mechanosensitive ion channel family protein [Elainellaceae cyanobacterium]